MAYHLTTQFGADELNPTVKRMAQVLDSIDPDDPEHCSVSLTHESEWNISVSASGHVTFENLEKGEPMPDYFRNHPVYYAGPAKTPAGYASGAFGPTTAGRMDSYVDQFQAAGGSMVMLAKGNRSAQVREACKKHRGFYLGSIGGPAARLAQDCIRKVDVLEYPELGMEAIWRIEVVDFPSFIVVDDKGNDFFAKFQG